jgi:DNA-binding transcriptional MocR family regulator
MNTGESYLYEKVVERISGLISEGVLRPGDRAPSVRRLSTQMEVSVTTVLQGYLLLESRGLIEARPQSGYYVKIPLEKLAPEPKASTPSSSATAVGVNELVAKVLEAARDPEMIPLGAAAPSHELLPVRQLLRVMAAVGRRREATAINFDLPPGYEALRRQIARRSLDAGCRLAIDEIVTTCGGMEALNLCLRAVAKAGDTIAIESPTFFGILQVIESLGMKALEIATHPREGIDLDALAYAVRKDKVAACMLVPNVSNPLGSCMPDKNKKALLDILKPREIPVIEDDIFGDLYFGNNRPKTVKAFDKEGLVLLCSSFSKTLAPGFRVGWTAPGRFKARVEQLKFMNTLATGSLPQMTIAQFLENGGYDRHLRRLKKSLAAQVQLVSLLVSRHFPQGTRMTRPTGGFVLWVELPKSLNSLELHRRALREKISITPRPIFSAKQKYRNCIRLSCAQPWSAKLEQAIVTLSKLAAKA